MTPRGPFQPLPFCDSVIQSATFHGRGSETQLAGVAKAKMFLQRCWKVF